MSLNRGQLGEKCWEVIQCIFANELVQYKGLQDTVPLCFKELNIQQIHMMYLQQCQKLNLCDHEKTPTYLNACLFLKE